MQILSRIFLFYLDASVHVAFSILAFVFATHIFLDIPLDFHLGVLLFFGSIGCYNFVKYGVEAEKYFKLTDIYHKHIQYFSIACLLIAASQFVFISKNTLLGIVVLTCLTAIYALPVLPKSKNLRSWGGLKIFIVATVWAGATVILPVLESKLPLSWDVWVETLQRFILVLILLLSFEIRDLSYDPPDLKTLPQRIGIQKTKIFGISLGIVFFILSFLKDNLTQSELLSKGLLALALMGVLWMTKKNQSRFFASFWVESIPVIWMLFYLI